MKKYVIALAILAVASVCGRALTLKEAFAALSQVPNVSVVDQLASGSVGLSADSVGNLEIAVADNLDAARIKATGDAAYAVLDKVPLEYMINGANNNLVAAFLYATPNAEGRYDFLVVSMDGAGSDVAILFMTITEATKTMFQNAPLTMKGDMLTLMPVTTGGSPSFNIMLKPPTDLRVKNAHQAIARVNDNRLMLSLGNVYPRISFDFHLSCPAVMHDDIYSCFEGG